MKNEYEIIGDIVQIKLTQDQVCYIDVADLALVSPYRWQARKVKQYNKFYAQHAYKQKNRVFTIAMTRLLLGVVDPEIFIDHIDGDTLNNRRSNLRLATNSENQWNRGAPKNSTTGAKNIPWDKRKQKFYLRIEINGRKKRYGFFDDINDAIIKRNELLPLLQGEYANRKLFEPKDNKDIYEGIDFVSQIMYNVNMDYDDEITDGERYMLYGDAPATEMDAEREYVHNYGMDHPDQAWINSPRDCTYANPFYQGPPLPHPDDIEDEYRESIAVQEDAEAEAMYAREVANRDDYEDDGILF